MIVLPGPRGRHSPGAFLIGPLRGRGREPRPGEPKMALVNVRPPAEGQAEGGPAPRGARGGTPYIVIGRHKFTPVQETLLAKAGLGPEVGRYAVVNDPAEPVNDAASKGAAIVVQALPLPLLAQMLFYAGRANVPVYAFRIEAVALVPAEAPCPPEADVELLDKRTGTKRCSKTTALQRLKKVVVEAEDVVKVEG